MPAAILTIMLTKFPVSNFVVFAVRSMTIFHQTVSFKRSWLSAHKTSASSGCMKSVVLINLNCGNIFE